MEPIYDNVTYDCLGFVEKNETGGFTAWTDTEFTGQDEPTEASFKTKRSAIAFIKKITKQYKKATE